MCVNVCVCEFFFFLLLIRILENLRDWIKNYSEDLKRDKNFVEKLKEFSNYNPNGSSKQEDQALNFFRSVLVSIVDGTIVVLYFSLLMFVGE